VLLIDDDEALGALLTEYLDQFGFMVRTVPRPDDGLEALAADPPDIVVLDVMLPGMDGFAVCRKVRERALHRHAHRPGGGAGPSWSRAGRHDYLPALEPRASWWRGSAVLRPRGAGSEPRDRVERSR
jgi:hypothetical protein